MPTEFKLPELGENVDRGDVVRVLVDGRRHACKKDQPVLELETDKATIEVPSTVAGTVTEVQVKPGDKVKVGQVVLTLDDGAAPRSRARGRRESRDRSQGGRAESAQPTSRRRSRRRAGRGRLQPGAARRGGGGAGAEAEAEARRGRRHQREPRARAGSAAAAAADAPAPARRRPRPSVRRLARELGVDIRRSRAPGPAAASRRRRAGARAERAVAGGGGARRRAARRCRTSRSGARSSVKPMSQHPPQDGGAPVASRGRHAARHAARQGRHHGARGAPQAVRPAGREGRRQADGHGRSRSRSSPPRSASSRSSPRRSTWRAAQIVYKKYVHIGVAVDTDRGLLVPVIRDVDRKTIIEIAVELGDAVAEGARPEAHARRDVGRRVHDHQPRRHRRHVVHADRQPAGSRDSRHLARRASSRCGSDNEFVPRLMLPLSLSYDHRVIDGADAARFLRFVAEALEQPFVMRCRAV